MNLEIVDVIEMNQLLSIILTGEPICNVENWGTMPYGTAVAESLLIIIETPRGCTASGL